MSSRRAVGAAPLVAGILLTSQSIQAIAQGGLSLWSVPGLVGGCAAILVGLGVLLEWREFEVESNDPSRASEVALVALALLGFAAGAVVAVV
jgi:hypothetical protein